MLADACVRHSRAKVASGSWAQARASHAPGRQVVEEYGERGEGSGVRTSLRALQWRAAPGRCNARHRSSPRALQCAPPQQPSGAAMARSRPSTARSRPSTARHLATFHAPRCCHAFYVPSVIEPFTPHLSVLHVAVRRDLDACLNAAEVGNEAAHNSCRWAAACTAAGLAKSTQQSRDVAEAPRCSLPPRRSKLLRHLAIGLVIILASRMCLRVRLRQRCARLHSCC
eukprot:363600-Chlamydomonas_euryale.AAC.6